MGTIPSWVRRGQKVTCIKVGGWDQVGGPDDARETSHPVLDGIYTIALVDPNWPGGLVMATFDECHPADFYWIDRFRPLIAGSLSADIALFRKAPDRTRTDAFVKIPHLGEVS